jgi:O2-independent ubiquinone biosynthesis accessory factor UbiT
MSTLQIPRFPSLGAKIMDALPLTPLALASARLVASMARRHPSLFRRLGAQAGKTFLIDAEDLPLLFVLRPRAENPELVVYRRGEAVAWDARIGGSLAALLGLVHGAYDGDALFFSRDLVIEGDTEAVLALRNAIDDSELDLPTEAAELLGPLKPFLDPPLRRLLPLAERLSGVALTRADRLVS